MAEEYRTRLAALQDQPLADDAASLTTAPDEFRTELGRQRARDLTASSLEAEERKPDEMAEAIRLGRDSGVPPAIAADNLDTLRQEQRQRELDRVRRESPTLARWLETPENMVVAKDELEPLSALGEAVGLIHAIVTPSVLLTRLIKESIDNRGATPSYIAKSAYAGLRYGIPQGIAGAGAALTETAGQISDVLFPSPNQAMARAYGMEAPGALTATGGEMLTEASAIKRDAEASKGSAKGVGFVGRSLAMGAESLGQQAPGVLASFLTGNPVPMLTYMGVLTHGAEYTTGREQGLDPMTSFGYAGRQTAFEVGTELLPAMHLFKNLKMGAPVWKTILQNQVHEQIGEQIATVSQDFNAFVTLPDNKDKTVGDFLRERPEAAAQTFIATLFASSVQSGTLAGIEKVVDHLSTSAMKAEQEQLSADRARAFGEYTRIVGEKAAALKLAGRSPEKLEEVVAAHAEANGVATVYMPVEEFETYYQSAGLDPAEVWTDLTGSPDGYTEAALSRADLAIPFAKLIARTAERPDEFKALQPHLKQTPDSMTAAEAEKFKPQIEATVAEGEALTTQPDEGKPEDDPVYKQAYADVLAAGATADQAKQYAYVTRLMFNRMAATDPQKRSAQDIYAAKFKAVPGAGIVGEGQGAQPPGLQLSQASKASLVTQDYEGRAGDAGSITRISHGLIPVRDLEGLDIGDAKPEDIDRPVLITVDPGRGVTISEGAGRLAAARARGDRDVQVEIRYFGHSEQEVPDGEYFQSARIRRPVPPEVSALASLVNALSVAKGQAWATNRDFKAALQDAVVAAAKDAKVDLTDYGNPQTEAYLIDAAVREGAAALAGKANAVGWYDSKTKKALRILSTLHPELATEESARFAMTWALAVTSNGLKVPKNFELAEAAYRGWRATGQMPPDIGVGTAAEAINDGLQQFNTLTARFGSDALRTFMVTKLPARDVAKAIGKKALSGEGQNVEVYGAAVLGPKIGNGFFANLYGHFEQLTIDRWLMRTWGRWTGSLIETKRDLIANKRRQFEAAIRMLTPETKKAFEEILGSKLTVSDLVGAADAIKAASTNKAKREAMVALSPLTTKQRKMLDAVLGEDEDRVSVGDELRKLGNRLSSLADGQVEAPRTTKERQFMRRVFNAALAELQRQHPALTMADLQAVLWYPEKLLYDTAAITEADVEATYEAGGLPDYETAAAALVRANGVEQPRIDAAAQEIDDENTARRAAGLRLGDGADRPGEAASAVADQAAPAAQADAGGVPVAGGVRGSAGVVDDPYRENQGARLEGSPAATDVPGRGRVALHGFKPAQEAAQRYAAKAGIVYNPPRTFVRVLLERARRLADAFTAMPDNPADPVTRAAYEQMVAETYAQYEEILATGLKIEFITGENPYKASPRLAILDVVENNHLWVFPTEDGFGSDPLQINVRSPLLEDSPYMISGRRARANDIFRVVHDYFGHIQYGNGFRADGEENAWRSHVSMYSPLAARAMTSETRGQNSWLNFGPFGEFNRTATADTVYADQKTGLLPEWASTEGARDETYNQPAYHGTPHEIGPEGFKLEKIGTGEGAQAYGWGLYFAENPTVAAGYHRMLAGRAPILRVKLGSLSFGESDGFNYSRRASDNDVENVRASLAEDLMIDETALHGVGEAGFHAHVLKELDERIANYYDPAHDQKMIDAAKKLRAELARPGALSIKWGEAPGGIYQVDIADEAVAKMLDWDAPLSQQPANVREALAAIAPGHYSPESDDYDANERGGMIVERLTEMQAERNDALPDDKADVRPAKQVVSETLRGHGVPGIRYLDEGSRGRPDLRWRPYSGSRIPANNGERVVINDSGFTNDDRQHAYVWEDGGKWFAMWEELTPGTATDHELGPFQSKQDARAAIAEKFNKTRNLVVFDEKIVTITHKDGTPVTKSERDEYLQTGPTQDKRGSITFLTGGGVRLQLNRSMDWSTFLHEVGGHLYFDHLIATGTQQGADAQVVADLDALLAHVGLEVRAADGEAAIRAAVKTSHHELVATSAEAYFREGKAPTPELQSLFDRLSSFLLELYDDIKKLVAQGYTTPLSDEVRGVFDRMLASQEAIDAARGQAGGPLLPIAEMRKLGVSEAKLRGYAEALSSATNKLQAKLLADLWRKKTAEYKGWIRAATDEVEAEVAKDPVYRAIAQLARGTGPDAPSVALNREQLVELYGEEFEQQHGESILDAIKAHGITASKDAEALELTALRLGFEGADQMVQAIVAKQPASGYVVAEAQRRVEEAHPDAMTDGSIEERAQAALHSSKRAQVLQHELELLGELAKQPVPSAAVIKEAARRLLGKRPVGEINPHRYLVAERKAASAATKAAAAAKYGEALVAKRQQAIAAALYREAQKAREQVAAFERLGKKLKRKATRESIAAGGQEFLIQIEQIAHVFGLGELSGARQQDWRSLREFVEGLQEAGEVTAVADGVLAAVEGKGRVALKALPLDQLAAAHEALKNLMHLAGQAKKVRIGNELVDRDEMIVKMVARAEESGLKRKPRPVGGSRRELSEGEKAKRGVAGFVLDITRPETLIEFLDGGQTGPWHDAYWRALGRSENALGKLQRRIGRELKRIRKSMPKDFMSSLDKPVVVAGIEMKRATLVAAVLNSGNESNLQRLMDGGIDGRKLTPAEVDAMREALTDDEARYVQELWDAVNSLWPDIVALQERMAGVQIERVEPSAFTINGRQMRGGYWPLVYDPIESDAGEYQSTGDALKDLQGRGVSTAVTSKGYTKGRVSKLNAALKLDFGQVLSRHLHQVMTDLSYRETVKHLSALLRDPRIKRTLEERLGEGGLDALKGNLAYVVGADSAVSGLVSRGGRKWLDFTLAQSSVAALAIRPDIALGNYVSGLVQGLDRAGLKGLIRGLYETAGPMRDADEFIRSKSDFMAADLEEWGHLYQQELQRTQGKRGFSAAYRRVMLTLHRIANAQASKAVWIGVYRNAVDAGQSDAEAVEMADKAVRQTQVARGRKDVATFERDSAFVQSRQFMAPMFVIFGRLQESARGVGARRNVGARAVGLMLQMFLAPALFALAAGRWAKDGDDDDELAPGEWALWLAANTLLFPLQTVPFLRDAGSAAESMLTGNPINPRAAPATQAAVAMIKASVELYKNVEQYMDDEEIDYLEATRDLVTATAPLTGAPASQFRISTKAAEAIMDDDDEGFVQMLLYGPPKP